MTLDARKRWLALYLLCLADIMIVLDTTIVNVALPAIREDLGFTQASLAWVVNAYLLTFGGFLLLGGRLGDLFGHRRLFLIGIAVFTVASLFCGLANSQEFLIVARAVQGVGGAVVSVVALSLIMIMFTEPAERAKAMGIVGIAAFAWCLVLLPKGETMPSTGRLDIAGAVTVTAAIMIAVYAIVNGNETGWTSGETIGLLAGAAVLLASFLAIEARASAPLVPLRLFKLRNVSTANVVALIMPGAMFGWFFLSALYMQLVLGYSSLEVGLAFLPGTIIWGIASIAVSDRLVLRYGFKVPLLLGLGFFMIGLLLFARAPVDGNFLIDILPGTIFFGLGGGITFNPLLLAAMGDVKPMEAGLASGVVNTSFMFGGALGLAVLASIAASRTENLLASGGGQLEALTSGYHTAFVVGAAFAAAAALIGGLLLRPAAAPMHGMEAPPGAEPATDPAAG
jgi:MFS family permease